MILPPGVTFHIGGLTFGEGTALGPEVPPHLEDKLPEHMRKPARREDSAAPRPSRSPKD